MEFTRLVGGERLLGSVRVSGAKNAALPILAASLLTEEECVIHNVPRLSDIATMVGIVRSVGAEVTEDKGIFRIKSENITSVPDRVAVKKMRGSICLIGALVSRVGKVSIPLPGGCVIGNRPIDLHIKGLKALGCNIVEEDGNLIIEGSDLSGNTINMLGPRGSTVTGTINVALAALSARGETIIEHAAREPEVVDFCKYLTAMGAKIDGVGSSTLRILGKQKLHGCEHTIIGDRIEAGTFVCGALITGGKLEICGLEKGIFDRPIEEFKKIGAQVFQNFDNRIYARAGGKLSNTNLKTGPHPQFPTDLQAQFTTLLTQSEGISLIEEGVYPDRFVYTKEICKMGANIEVGPHGATICGARKLVGTDVFASDLRASAALYLAGLCAEGETRIHDIHHLDRGYENFEFKLRSLGANVERVKISL